MYPGCNFLVRVDVLQLGALDRAYHGELVLWFRHVLDIQRYIHVFGRCLPHPCCERIGCQYLLALYFRRLVPALRRKNVFQVGISVGKHIVGFVDSGHDAVPIPFLPIWKDTESQEQIRITLRQSIHGLAKLAKKEASGS